MFLLRFYLHFRPTATELLKNPFFKKAKDKKYLQQTLIAIGPSLETRVLKVNILNFLIIIFKLYIIAHFEYIKYFCRLQRSNLALVDCTEL